MTANQLAYQKNLIAEDEARTASRNAQTKALEQLEQQRAHQATESLKAQELAQELRVAQEKLEQAERENVAKYGTLAYGGKGEERGGVREITNLPFDFFKKILDTFSPFTSIFKGK